MFIVGSLAQRVRQAALEQILHKMGEVTPRRVFPTGRLGAWYWGWGNLNCQDTRASLPVPSMEQQDFHTAGRLHAPSLRLKALGQGIKPDR